MAGLFLEVAASKLLCSALCSTVGSVIASRINPLGKLKPELMFLARKNAVYGKTVKVSG